jgi:hypothetical protein
MPIAWLFVLASLLPPATATEAVRDRGVLETAVGMEGVYYLRHRGPAVAALPVDENSPVVLRIAKQTESGDSTIYEIRYLGTKPGRYDLRSYLRYLDGRSPAELPPMIVSVVSVLPADHNGQLDELAYPSLPRAWPYRAVMIAAGGLWLVPLAWLLARAAVRRKPRAAAPATTEPTLADELHPLVEGAIAGSLSAAEQARLELLLVAYWRKQLDLCGCSTEAALAQLRGHPEAGILLEQLDQWLHRRPGSNGEINVAAILRPYREKRGIGPISERRSPERSGKLDSPPFSPAAAAEAKEAPR